MVHSRRRFCKAVGAATGVAATAGCLDSLTRGEGGEYPSQTIEIVTPMSEGGGNDTYMRPLADPLSAELDADVIAVNQPPPLERYNELYEQSDDGYQITVFNPTAFMPIMLDEGADSVFNGSNWHSLGAPSTSSMVLGLSTNAEAESWEEAVELSEEEDRVWRAGNLGAPSQGPYYELMEAGSGIQIDTIEGFESTAEIVASMERGEVDMNLGPASSMAGFVNDDILRPILAAGDDVLGDPILDQYAEIGYEGVAPSFAEVGLDDLGILAQTLRAVVAPPDVPDDRAEMLREGVWNAINSDEYQDALDQADAAIFNPVSPDEMESIFAEKADATEQL